MKVGLAPAREALYTRIHARTDAMLTHGWIEELHVLLDGNLPENAKPFDFIGYRELRAVLRGEMKMEDARNAIQQSTRQYAKRQMTWFRKEPAVHWCEGFGDDPQVQAKSLKQLGEFIP